MRGDEQVGPPIGVEIADREVIAVDVAATALDLEAAESALSEARRALIQGRFAVLSAEASAWLAAGSLADVALENFK